MKNDVIKNKKIVTFAVIATIISLSGCGNVPADEEGVAGKSSKGSASSDGMNREDAQDKLMELSEKLMNGEITPEEAEKMKKEITGNIESQEELMKRTTDNILDFDGMPSWAKSANILEPKGLTLVASESSITKAKGSYPDGFSAVYDGGADELMLEAKRLTEELGLNVDVEDVASGTLMASGEINDKYTVVITVADNGEGVRMYYAASDMTEQKELMERHNK